MTGHVTAPAAALADQLPGWVSLLRAPNPGPLTLDGTNTWVVRAPGAAGAIVIDPGTAEDGHLEAIAKHVPISSILVTHGHPDHVGGVVELAERVDARVFGPVPGHPPVTAGAVFTAGEVRLTALATPGHTADSVCFLAEHADVKVIFTGDTILGRGTTVIAEPDGDLGAYLDSLELLAAYDGVPALPGHGPALADCGAAARFYLAHRRARLDQVRQALADGAQTVQDVVATIYADVDRSLWPAAEWTVRAQLKYLTRQTGESAPGTMGLDTL
ncbi:MAG TPA: MBL fold metallo-hydrolase [Micromonosporaceae bacterium]